MPARTSRSPATPPGSAVVTGGARGIGRSLVERLVARGHAVVVTDVDGDAAATTARETGAAAGLAQDVREEESHARVAAEAARHAPLRVWCNNAGVGHDGTLAELTSAQVDQLLTVNLHGVAWGMRAALAAFAEHGRGGDIVNTASLSGLGPVPGLSTYAATKAAVVSLTTSVAAEAPRGVRVHAVCPDGVSTAMVDAMSDQGMGKKLVASGGRMLSSAEVADAAVGMLGTSRVVRTLPAWRGAMLRATTLAPSVAARATALLAAQGARTLRRTD